MERTQSCGNNLLLRGQKASLSANIGSGLHYLSYTPSLLHTHVPPLGHKHRSWRTSAIIIDHGCRPPLQELHQVQNGIAQRGIVGIKVGVEGVPVVYGMVLPTDLDMRNFQRIADGLNGIGRGAMRRPEYRHHSQGQLITGWIKKSEPSTVC